MTHRPAAALLPPPLPWMRGWRKTVGNLIEFSSAQRGLSRASIYWYMREQQKSTVSSTSRSQTILFQQYSAILSLDEKCTAEVLPVEKVCRALAFPAKRNFEHLFRLGLGLPSGFKIDINTIYDNLMLFNISLNVVFLKMLNTAVQVSANTPKVEAKGGESCGGSGAPDAEGLVDVLAAPAPHTNTHTNKQINK